MRNGVSRTIACLNRSLGTRIKCGIDTTRRPVPDARRHEHRSPGGHRVVAMVAGYCYAFLVLFGPWAGWGRARMDVRHILGARSGPRAAGEPGVCLSANAAGRILGFLVLAAAVIVDVQIVNATINEGVSYLGKVVSALPGFWFGWLALWLGWQVALGLLLIRRSHTSSPAASGGSAEV